ncbi:MAG: transcriptional regulator GcvA [Aromatoleum sp.]|jgi:LysR family glycine cleavage system transcriptional activator|uniref:transcriptional regulator GcvA n=1 Tax=Aromatoleum sp. TaxID=2307007 RepID=UPI00289478CF|nr:transcriptional regulator GcvA [Aromatoleum sp.]MDT3671988.1 transcriptional regulator GcvA [Aromatoleum sp.]
MSVRLPPLNALRAFEIAARHLSFKLAAEELSVTPTAISHQIRGLEEDLGVPLFRRLTRALELTPEGEAMLPKLREAMAAITASVEAVRALRPVSRLSVVAPPSFASRWLVPRLHRFSRLHPGIELHLASATKAIDASDPGGLGVDPPQRGDGAQLWIRFGSGRYPGYRADWLFEPEYTAVCSPALLRAKIPLRQPSDLQRHNLIYDDTVPDSRERPTWVQWLEVAGVPAVRPEAGLHFSDSGLAIAAALDGLGVALLSKPLVAAEVAAGRLVVPFDIGVRRRFAYYIVSSEATAELPTVAAFRAWLLDEVRAAEFGGDAA